MLAEAARAAQVRDALQAERQENAALLSACAEKTEEALRVLVEAKAAIDQLEKDLEEAMALLKMQDEQMKADGEQLSLQAQRAPPLKTWKTMSWTRTSS